MEATIAAYIQPLLLALICAITGFSAWQMKKWMERIEADHNTFYARINNLDQLAIAANEDRRRKEAALGRVFQNLEKTGDKITRIELENVHRDERISIVEKRVDKLETA